MSETFEVASSDVGDLRTLLQPDADRDAEAAPAPFLEAAAPADEAPKRPFLTARCSDELGPAGHFIDLTEVEAQALPSDILLEPTPEQLARRR